MLAAPLFGISQGCALPGEQICHADRAVSTVSSSQQHAGIGIVPEIRLLVTLMVWRLEKAPCIPQAGGKLPAASHRIFTNP